MQVALSVIDTRERSLYDTTMAQAARQLCGVALPSLQREGRPDAGGARLGSVAAPLDRVPLPCQRADAGRDLCRLCRL